ncbi:MAG: GntR family transcriptional regulator [Pseudomonadota bacterium]
MIEKPGSNDAGQDAVGWVSGHIATAILEQRLLPGTKLGEAALGEIFDVSRPVVRRVLTKLAHDKLVDRHSHRGAFIASPTVEEARQVFEARRVIEDALVRACVARVDAQIIAGFRAHIEAEARCAAKGDRPRWIRLTGEFHSLIAEASGNAVLTDILSQLIAQTSLIIGLYGNRMWSACCDGDHAWIVDAIAGGDVEGAASRMRDHLHACEASLSIEPDDGRPDLREIFADLGVPKRAKRKSA